MLQPGALLTWPWMSRPEGCRRPDSALSSVDLPHCGGPSSSVMRPCGPAPGRQTPSTLQIWCISSPLRVQHTPYNALQRRVSCDRACHLLYVRDSIQLMVAGEYEAQEAEQNRHRLQHAANVLQNLVWPPAGELDAQLRQRPLATSGVGVHYQYVYWR
jgi:hypothetical protein